jgi:hydroxymethylbilane synthase
LATERHGAASEAEAMGRDAGLELKRRGGPGFLST